MNEWIPVKEKLPHLTQAGEKSWLALKYGRLTDNWREMLKKGFAECFRCLKMREY